MTIAKALKLAASRLSAKHINIPRLEAEILLSGILKKPTEFLTAHGEKKLSPAQINKYRLLIKRRLTGEPIAYLTGHKEFYGLDFKVSKNVLIPRPETELLVDEAVKQITDSQKQTTIVDVGAGSGCIIIALAKLLNQELRIMNHELWGIDLSPKALMVARQNARIHQTDKNIKFVQGNLLNPIIHDSLFIIHNSLIILANLPYGWKAWKNNCSMDSIGLKYEPKIALFADKNGLGLYEKLFQQINKLRITSRGLRCVRILCEFDPRQTAKMKKLIKRELPEAILQIKKDLAGLNRLAIIQITTKKNYINLKNFLRGPGFIYGLIYLGLTRLVKTAYFIYS